MTQRRDNEHGTVDVHAILNGLCRHFDVDQADEVFRAGWHVEGPVEGTGRSPTLIVSLFSPLRTGTR